METHGYRAAWEEIMIRMTRMAALGLLAATSVLTGCLTLPHRDMEKLTPVQPGPGEMVVLNDLYIIVDASGSMHLPSKFRIAKDVTELLADAVPDDYYGVQLLSYGGEWKMDWLNMPMATFDRAKLKDNASRLRFLSGSTPLAEALDSIAPTLKDQRTHSAVLILSDGMSDRGAALASARALLSAHPGRLCFHTIHLGCEEEGAALLQDISGLTDCGTTRHSDALWAKAGIETLVRDIFFGNYGDSDGDGVPDPRDLCPDTPAGMPVNGYGCHTWGTVYFDTDKAVIKKNAKSTLDEVAARINANPGTCLRVEGHADSRNEVEYNQKLSERRVNAVRDALINRGVEPGRLITTGFSELKPAVPNTSAHNMALNRRVELVPLP